MAYDFRESLVPWGFPWPGRWEALWCLLLWKHMVPEGDRFWGCLSCSSDNCRTFSQKPKTSTEQSGTSWKQEGHLQMYHSTMRYTQLQEFAKGSIDVPSIPLGRGFVTRGLESYESSEHPMHPWVNARTWTRSCKRWSEKFDFTSDPLSTQTFSTFQHVREFAVGCKETAARACRVPLGLCGGRAGRCADLRQSGRLASCLLRPASSNCISPDDDTPHHALIFSCRNAAGSVASQGKSSHAKTLDQTPLSFEGRFRFLQSSWTWEADTTLSGSMSWYVSFWLRRSQFGSLYTFGFGFSSECALATTWPSPRDR